MPCCIRSLDAIEVANERVKKSLSADSRSVQSLQAIHCAEI